MSELQKYAVTSERKWISIVEELGKNRMRQIVNLYQQAFSGAPWYESYGEDEAREIIERDITRPNALFVLFEDPNCVVQAFGWGYSCDLTTLCDQADSSNDTEFIRQNIESTFPQESGAYYISEVVVNQDYQRKGLGDSIVKLLIHQAKNLPTYLYTSQLSPMTIVAERNGMNEILPAGSLSQNKNLVLYRTQ